MLRCDIVNYLNRNNYMQTCHDDKVYEQTSVMPRNFVFYRNISVTVHDQDDNGKVKCDFALSCRDNDGNIVSEEKSGTYSDFDSFLVDISEHERVGS